MGACLEVGIQTKIINRRRFVKYCARYVINFPYRYVQEKDTDNMHACFLLLFVRHSMFICHVLARLGSGTSCCAPGPKFVCSVSLWWRKFVNRISPWLAHLWWRGTGLDCFFFITQTDTTGSHRTPRTHTKVLSFWKYRNKSHPRHWCSLYSYNPN